MGIRGAEKWCVACNYVMGGESDDLLEHRTDGTDAFYTLYIGAAKFPYREILLSRQREFYNVILTLFDLCAQEYFIHLPLTLPFKKQGIEILLTKFLFTKWLSYRKNS